MNYNPSTKLIDMRHYVIRATPVGLNKGTKKVFINYLSILWLGYLLNNHISYIIMVLLVCEIIFYRQQYCLWKQVLSIFLWQFSYFKLCFYLIMPVNFFLPLSVRFIRWTVWRTLLTPFYIIIVFFFVPGGPRQNTKLEPM